jgi:hypothetical protein
MEAATVASRLNHPTLEGFMTALVAELVRLHEANAALAARLVALEVTQSLHDRIAEPLADRADSVLPRSLLIDSAFPLPAHGGFQPLEYDSAGRAFRWTGPEPTFHFELMIDRSAPAALRLRCCQLRVQFPTRPIRCFVDGAEIATDRIAVDGEFEIAARLPSRDQPGATVIMFLVPGPQAESLFSAEPRKLWLAFRWLKIDGEATGEGWSVPAPDRIFAAPETPERETSLFGASTVAEPDPAAPVFGRIDGVW